MNKPIQIRHLVELEAADLMKTAEFNALSPVRCMSCGSTSDFERQVFWVGGVPKAERNSDSSQTLIAYHLKEKYRVDSVFFKTNQNELYVDSAKCKRCASTMIEFDIELSDEVLAEISRLTTIPIKELKSGIEEHAKGIAKTTGN